MTEPALVDYFSRSYMAWALLVVVAWTLLPHLYRAALGQGFRLRDAARSPEWGLVVAILVALAVVFALDPDRSFFSLYSDQNLFHDVAMYGVLALGATIVIISGGIDLSIGSVVALSAVVGAKLLTTWLPGLPGLQPTARAIPPTLVIATVALCLLLGLAIGLLHALLIVQLRLPPFIATLATMAGLRSVALLVSKNSSVPVPDVPYDAFRALGRDNAWTLTIFAAAALALSLLMGATVLGRHLYALGGNEAAARLSGLRTGRLKAVAYGLAGMLSALGGLLFAGYTGSVRGTIGAGYELQAITAAVVGGCSLAGGVGSIRGTVLGLILIRIIIQGTGLVVRGIDSTQVEGLVLGTVVVLAVAFNQGTLSPRVLLGRLNRLWPGRDATKKPPASEV